MTAHEETKKIQLDLLGYNTAQATKAIVLAIADAMRLDGQWDWSLQRQLDTDVTFLDKVIMGRSLFTEGSLLGDNPDTDDQANSISIEWMQRADNEGYRYEMDDTGFTITWEPLMTIEEYVLHDYEGSAGEPLRDKTQEAIFLAGVNAVLALLDNHDQLTGNGLIDDRTLAEWKEYR